VNEPDAAKTLRAEPVFREVGNENILVRADENVSDASGAVHDEPDLSADGRGNFSQSAGSFWCDGHIRGCFSAVEALEHSKLGRFEARGIAVYSRDVRLLE